MKFTKRRIFVIVIILLVVAGGISVVTAKKKKTPPTAVTVETAQMRRLVSTVSATGKVEPVTQVKISAEIPGRIIKLPVKEGDRVEVGQFLLELDPEIYRSSVEAAQSSLRSARAQKQKSEADLRRISGLVEKGMGSEADLDAANASAELAAADLDRAVAQERNAKENLNKTHIVSPMAGTISMLSKKIGENTLGSQFQEDVIMNVADLSKMQVKAQVDENDIVGVKAGDSVAVSIDAYPDTTFRGVVSEISQSAKTAGLGSQQEATNFDVKVAVLDTVVGIRPGMSVTVEIETDHLDNALSVSIQCVALRDKSEGKAVEIQEKAQPKSSRRIAEEARAGTADTTKLLKREDLETGVFVFTVDSAVWKPVRTGISSDRYLAILSGVAEGDSIINGPYKELAKDLKHGTKVKLKSKDEKGPKKG
jgi:HlyD family secretion protein